LQTKSAALFHWLQVFCLCLNLLSFWLFILWLTHTHTHTHIAATIVFTCKCKVSSPAFLWLHQKHLYANRSGERHTQKEIFTKRQMLQYYREHTLSGSCKMSEGCHSVLLSLLLSSLFCLPSSLPFDIFSVLQQRAQVAKKIAEVAKIIAVGNLKLTFHTHTHTHTNSHTHTHILHTHTQIKCSCDKNKVTAKTIANLCN